MRNLCFLLIPMGIVLLIFSIRKMIRFAKSEIFFEMPCIEEEGSVHLPQGNYGIWLSGRRFKKTPIGNIGFQLSRAETGEKLYLSPSLMHMSVTSFDKGRMELYHFQVEEEGNYTLSLDGESSVRDRLEASIGNLLFKQPVDLSNFTVQIRKGNSMAVLFVILGINLAVWMILGGIMLPFLLAEAGY